MATRLHSQLTSITNASVQTVQQHAEGMACGGVQVATLRERLIKLAAWITRSARRIVLYQPKACA